MIDSIMSKEQEKFIQWASTNAEMISIEIDSRFDRTFDYSIESLESLDKVLELFSEHLAEMKDDDYKDFVRQAGFYIFEVARRNFGGIYYWYDHLNQPILVTGLPEFEISLLAFDKVEGRLKNGYEDNIPYFFKGYSEKVIQAKRGDRAMIC